MTVLVAGAGIGGLVLALSLERLGVTVRLYESVSEIRPLGVGINLQPHAVKELEALDLLTGLEAAGLSAAGVGYFTAQGREIWSEPRGRKAGYNWPQISVHRGHLQMLLLDAVRTRLGPEAVVTGTAVDGWQEADDGVVIRAGSDEVRGALFVAADGIHSAARARLWPDEGPPLWNQTLMWRGTTWAPPFLGGRTMAMIGTKSRKFVCYPIAEDGDRVLVNWIADLAFPKDHVFPREDWNRPGHASDLMADFGDWCFDWIDVPGLIERAEAIFQWPMVDRDPLERWSHGRMTLLGDAAHPMYPIGSNGASQAILDARVLARSIRDHGLTPEALETYEAERRPATAAIVRANRGDGPDRVLDIVADRAPDGFDQLDDVISQDELEAIALGYKQTAGMDMARLNAAPSVLG